MKALTVAKIIYWAMYACGFFLIVFYSNAWVAVGVQFMVAASHIDKTIRQSEAAREDLKHLREAYENARFNHGH